MKKVSAAAILLLALSSAPTRGSEIKNHLRTKRHHHVLAQTDGEAAEVLNRGNFEVLETGKETIPEEPEAGAEDSKTNCCVPIKRTHQKATLTDSNLTEFKNNFLAQYNTLNKFLYEEVGARNADTTIISNQAYAVLANFNLPAEQSNPSSFDKISGLTSSAASSSDVIDMEYSAAVKLFKQMV